jgi:hypothetical protein
MDRFTTPMDEGWLVGFLLIVGVLALVAAVTWLLRLDRKR